MKRCVQHKCATCGAAVALNGRPHACPPQLTRWADMALQAEATEQRFDEVLRRFGRWSRELKGR